MEVKYRGADTHNRVVRIPRAAFTPTKKSSGGLREEAFHIGGLRSLPNLNGRRPGHKRIVKEPYYRNTGGNWPGFRYRNNYAVRWTGSLMIGRAAYYNFWTYSDDGSKLWIDNAQVVNNDGLHGWRGKGGSRRMSTGMHSFRAEMFERGGAHGMEVKYRGPDTRNRVVRIPRTAFTSAKRSLAGL